MIKKIILIPIIAGIVFFVYHSLYTNSNENPEDYFEVHLRRSKLFVSQEVSGKVCDFWTEKLTTMVVLCEEPSDTFGVYAKNDQLDKSERFIMDVLGKGDYLMKEKNSLQLTLVKSEGDSVLYHISEPRRW